MAKVVLFMLVCLNAIIALSTDTPLFRISSVVVLLIYSILGVFNTEFPKIGKDD